MDTIEANKENMLKEYRSALSKALEGTIAELEVFVQVADSLEDKEKAEKSKANFTSSIERYTALKNEVETKDRLSNKDYKLLAIALVERSNRMMSESQKIMKAAEQLTNMSKVFFA